MSETLIDQATSEDRAQKPGSRMVINLVIAMLATTLGPFLVYLLFIPLWLASGALFYFGIVYVPPGTMQNLAEAAGVTATAALYLGGAAVLCVGIQFVVFGIPTAILGWRSGRITPLSSTIAGALIGFLPWLLILPFDRSYDPNYISTSTLILRSVGTIVGTGVVGAVEGYIFWLVWWFLSRHSEPKKQTSGLG
jgi:hypothetical protein